MCGDISLANVIVPFYWDPWHQNILSWVHLNIRSYHCHKYPPPPPVLSFLYFFGKEMCPNVVFVWQLLVHTTIDNGANVMVMLLPVSPKRFLFL